MLLSLQFFGYQISTFVLYILLGLFLFFLVSTFIFLSAFAKNKLFIDNNKIELVNLKNASALKLNEIYKIKIKRRTNKLIREIYLWSENGSSLFISAFENDFEKIEKIIRNGINKDVVIKEIVEPLDFDNFLFYPIFGLCSGALSILFFNSLLNLNSKTINFFFYTFNIYSFTLGIFFILKKPLFSRTAKKNATTDYVIGAILIIFSIFVLFNMTII